MQPVFNIVPQEQGPPYNIPNQVWDNQNQMYVNTSNNVIQNQGEQWQQNNGALPVYNQPPNEYSSTAQQQYSQQIPQNIYNESQYNNGYQNYNNNSTNNMQIYSDYTNPQVYADPGNFQYQGQPNGHYQQY